MQGVYAITNTVTGEQYIGRAQHILHRWSTHMYLLETCDHTSPTLQEAWGTYGPTAFTWSILEIVEDFHQLKQTEREYITRLQPAYNTINMPDVVRRKRQGERKPLPERTAKGGATLQATSLRKLRFSRLITQKELANAAGVSRSIVAIAERGAQISLTTAEKIAAALGATVDDLTQHAPAGEK